MMHSTIFQWWRYLQPVWLEENCTCAVLCIILGEVRSDINWVINPLKGLTSTPTSKFGVSPKTNWMDLLPGQSLWLGLQKVRGQQRSPTAPKQALDLQLRFLHQRSLLCSVKGRKVRPLCFRILLLVPGNKKSQLRYSLFHIIQFWLFGHQQTLFLRSSFIPRFPSRPRGRVWNIFCRKWFATGGGGEPSSDRHPSSQLV